MEGGAEEASTVWCIRLKMHVQLVFRDSDRLIDVIGYDRNVFFVLFRSQTSNTRYLNESAGIVGAAEYHFQTRIHCRHTKDVSFAESF